MVNWLKLDTVFLDMDGTLLDLHYDNHFWLEHLPRRYAEHFRLTPEQGMDKILPLITAARGQLKWYCTDHWSEVLCLDVANLKAETRDRIAYRPHVTDFLLAIRARGLNCVIVTNCHPDPLALKLEVTGLDRHVDAIVSSHQLGKPKEDTSFWTDLQQYAPYDPRTTLMVDDSIPVLESALAAGISQCLAILAPDSQKPPGVPHPVIPSIAHFNELMPL